MSDLAPEQELARAQAEIQGLKHELAQERDRHQITQASLDAAIQGQKRLFQWLDELKAGKQA